jgi:hypothetical protein
MNTSPDSRGVCVCQQQHHHWSTSDFIDDTAKQFSRATIHTADRERNNKQITMERVLPGFARVGIEKMIEFAYSFEPYFAPTVVLGE